MELEKVQRLNIPIIPNDGRSNDPAIDNDQSPYTRPNATTREPCIDFVVEIDSNQQVFSLYLS